MFTRSLTTVYLILSVHAYHNLMAGCTVSITDGLSTTNYDSSSTFATNICQDTLQTFSSNMGDCSPTTVQGATITFDVVPAAPIIVRTLVIIPTETTLSNGAFSSYNYYAYSGNAIVDQATGLTTKTVRYHQNRITVDKIRFTMITGSNSVKFCMDSLIASNAHWLNAHNYVGWKKW